MENLLTIEADLEKAITDYIRDELNDNKYGVDFHLGFWYQHEDQREEIRVPDGNTPFKKDKQYVPCAIEVFDGKILGLEGVFNVEYTVPITFQIRIDDDEDEPGTFFEKVVRAINQVKNRNRGQLKRLKVKYIDDYGNEQEELFTTATTTQNLTPIGDLELIRGENYVFGQIEWYFDVSKDIVYGNQVRVFLEPLGGEEDEVPPNIEMQRIYPLEPNMVRDNTPESIQNFDTPQAYSIIQESEYSLSFAIIMKDDDLHWHILKDHVNKQNLQELYRLKLEFYGFSGENKVKKFEFIDTIVIMDAVVFFGVGEEMTMALSIKKYIDELPPDYDITQLNKPVYDQQSTQIGNTFAVVYFENDNPVAVMLEADMPDIQKLPDETQNIVIQPNSVDIVTFSGLEPSTAYTVRAKYQPNTGITNYEESEFKYITITTNTPPNVTASFDTDGGTFIYSQTGYSPLTLTDPGTPTKSGFNFMGWSPSLPDVITSDTTFEAEWAWVEGTLLNTYCDGFDLWGTYADGQGGTYPELIETDSESCGHVEVTATFNTDGGTYVDSQTGLSPLSLTQPDAPTKSGYDFLGWSPTLPASISENTTFTATWTISEGN